MESYNPTDNMFPLNYYIKNKTKRLQLHAYLRAVLISFLFQKYELKAPV